MTQEIDFRDDAFPDDQSLAALMLAAWGHAGDGKYQHILARSLCHITAYAGDRLIGYVNVATDGGQHAFLLDTSVHPDFQRQGIATKLVERATELSRQRGAQWLHVDYEPHLERFYAACGFRPTSAGLIAL